MIHRSKQLWIDDGIILNKISSLRQNYYIITVFCKERGIYKGVIQNDINQKLQVGSITNCKYYCNGDRMGYFICEIKYLININNLIYIKLTAILSIVKTIIKTSSERQCMKNSYNALYNFIKNLQTSAWITYFIIFEFNYLKDLGYGINLNESYHLKKILQNKITNISIDDIRKILEIINLYFKKNCFDPFNIKVPIFRQVLFDQLCEK
ncbi:MAG: DNA repair protein RecO C-terminal domain-containing protein [Anaplasmataceae bacterium]|nr:DNA repair protein RecO C-terminal domain-containing protein [Anaplasmataceae bacterium]